MQGRRGNSRAEFFNLLGDAGNGIPIDQGGILDGQVIERDWRRRARAFIRCPRRGRVGITAGRPFDGLKCPVGAAVTEPFQVNYRLN